jgi:hypothetical protein
MQTYYFTPALLGPEESWRLLRWCAEHGGAELTVRVLCASHPAPIADGFEDAFAGSLVAEARRRVISSASGGRMQTVRLWHLTDHTMAALRTFLPAGLFTNVVDPAGWLEDPIVYRNGESMLGVVTHEQEGLLRATAEELRELETLGFDFERSSASIEF